MTKPKPAVTLESLKSDIAFMLDAYDKGFMSWRVIRRKLKDLITETPIEMGEKVEDVNDEGRIDEIATLDLTGGG